MRVSILTGIALMTQFAMTATATEPLSLDNETARISYSLGYQVGGDFKRQAIAVEPRALVKGIEDAISGADPSITPETMQATLLELKRKIVAEQRAKSGEAKLHRIAEGERFLQENAKKPGVTTTESGLQYQILEEGTGISPSPTDQVIVTYRGTLIDGSEFDSSFSRGKPATFRLNGVIRGWTEGLQLIKEGGKIKLFVPQKLAYGDRGPLAHRTLIFDVELLSVGEKAQLRTPAEDQQSGDQK